MDLIGLQITPNSRCHFSLIPVSQVINNFLTHVDATFFQDGKIRLAVLKKSKKTAKRVLRFLDVFYTFLVPILF